MLVILNHSSHQLVIHWRQKELDRVYSAAPNSTTRIQWPGEEELLHIECDSKPVQEYKTTRVPMSFWKNERLTVQFEPDEIFYVVAPGALSPVKIIPTQPAGLPWKPIHLAP